MCFKIWSILSLSFKSKYIGHLLLVNKLHIPLNLGSAKKCGVLVDQRLSYLTANIVFLGTDLNVWGSLISIGPLKRKCRKFYLSKHFYSTLHCYHVEWFLPTYSSLYDGNPFDQKGIETNNDFIQVLHIIRKFLNSLLYLRFFK